MLSQFDWSWIEIRIFLLAMVSFRKPHAADQVARTCFLETRLERRGREKLSAPVIVRHPPAGVAPDRAAAVCRRAIFPAGA